MLTNVDLGRIRFNQIQYNRKDLEDTVIVPPRDRLIVETYLNHVPGRKAVAFCVNVRHGDDLAELFRRSGVAAPSVSGRMPRADREKYLTAFHNGDLRVLCHATSSTRAGIVRTWRYCSWRGRLCQRLSTCSK